ncbi:MAG: hypothetical protein Q8O71_01590 [bacterium]|nr:hypothetical protein [bacterium]
MTTQTSDEILGVIQAAAQAAASDVRHVHAIAHGQYVRQGDVLLVRVADGHPHGPALPSRQLAEGTTQGSRHVAEAPCYAATTPPPGAAATAFLGPCVVSPERFVVTHPEHAHFSLPAGTYQVVQQRDERTQRRMAD